MMREIQASEAKARLPQLLNDVERGETLIITRHGRAIARTVPEVDRRQEEVDKGDGEHPGLMPLVLDASIAAGWAFPDE
jgi:prevent-host-death family protein